MSTIFFLYLLSGIGITNLLVNASLLEPIRNFIFGRFKITRELIECMLCTGFWVGVFLYIPFYSLFSFSIFGIIISGAIVSFASSFYDILTDWLISVTEFSISEDVE